MRDEIIIALPGVIFILFLLTAQADPVDRLWYDDTRQGHVFQLGDNMSCGFQTGISDYDAVNIVLGHCIDVKLYPTSRDYGRQETWYCVVDRCDDD